MKECRIVIKKQKTGSLNNEDRLDLCRLLAKAGYIVGNVKLKGTSEYVVIATEPTEEFSKEG